MTVDLKDFDTVFCDSPASLLAARAQGLSEKAVILTTAPAIKQSEPHAVDIEAQIPAERIQRFIAGVGKYTEKLHAVLRMHPDIGGDACSAAYGAFNEHKYLHKALVLTQHDCLEPRAILQPLTGDKRIDFVLQSLWPALLAINPRASTINLHVSKPTRGSSLGGRPPSFLQRLQNLRLDRLAYHALSRFGSFVSVVGSKPKIIVIRDSNELVKETALSFALRGHPLVVIADKASVEAEIKADVEATVRKTSYELFNDIFADIFVPSLHELLQERLFSGALREMKIVASGMQLWQGHLHELSKGGAVILHGGPIGGRGRALHKAAQAEGVRLYGFQHGVRREIANWPLDVRVLNENNFSDMLLCYNAEGATYSAGTSPFAIAPAQPVGMPRDYRVGRGHFTHRAEQPMIYVSTLLYRGSRQLSNTALSDPQRSDRERVLLTDVLAKVPHRVRYKPYPSLRYEGEDPVHAAVSAAKNIDIFEDEIDLRYMLRQHRVAITTGATSTVGWCALSELPLIFIDDAEAQPLNARAREMFEAAFFIFDTREANYKKALLEFLSQPIEDIEAQSAMKVDARRIVQREFFGLADGASGFNAYRIICDDMSRAQKVWEKTG